MGHRDHLENAPRRAPTSLPALLDILAARAGATPDQPAYVFLPDGETETERTTYGELWRTVRAWAAEIEARTAPGARVLLLLPTGLDFLAVFLGCLEAQRIAVPAYPPPPYRASRIRAIAADAAPALVVGSDRNLDGTKRALGGIAAIAASAWMNAEDLDLSRNATWSGAPNDPSRTAFLQYTSGSTGAPKGVRVTYANLAHNQARIQVAFRVSSATPSVSWLPLFHDMGLVGALLEPLYIGALCALMPANAFLQKPVRWLRAISKYRAFCSGGPNFAYDLCTRKITAAESAGLDLSSWSVAFNGAEPVRAATLDAFAARFADHGFRAEAFLPCYGMAESTLLISARQAPAVRRAQVGALELGRYQEAGPHETARTLVSCGTVSAPDVRIVRPDSRCEAEAGEIGEIWLSSLSIADGYWRQAEATAEHFQARLAGSGDGPFLRTGDLGVIVGGELFITGRLKDLIILRGANHYPQDIEDTLCASHAALRTGGGAAFTVDIDAAGEERLVVVQEVERESLRRLDVVTVGEAAREAVLREHGLELAVLLLVKPGGVPKTSSGKVQRRECRSAFLQGTLPAVAESRPLSAPVGTWGSFEAMAEIDDRREVLRQGECVPQAAVRAEAPRSAAFSPTDARLARSDRELRRWLNSLAQQRAADVLQVSPRQVLLDRNFSQLGFDSLKGLEVIGRLSDELGLDLSPTLLFEFPTLAKLSEHLVRHHGPALLARRDARHNTVPAAGVPLE